jgi:hypothetical protein
MCGLFRSGPYTKSTSSNRKLSRGYLVSNGPQRDEHGAAADGLFCRYSFLHDIQMLYEFSTNNAKDVGARRRVQYRLVYTISGRAKFRSGPHLAEIVAPPETVTDSRTTVAKESGGSRRPTPSESHQATGGV